MEEAAAVGAPFRPSLESPFRWQDWAAPGGAKRKELQSGALGFTFAFVNGELLPKLRGLTELPGATPRQQVVGQIMESVESVRIDPRRTSWTCWTQCMESAPRPQTRPTYSCFPRPTRGCCCAWGRRTTTAASSSLRGSDSGHGEDRGSETGGEGLRPRLRHRRVPGQSYDYMKEGLGQSATASQLDRLATETFYGREKENLIYPIALANLVLHGIDRPNIWHGNTLTRNESYGGLFRGAPDLFDVILMNPPFGGKRERTPRRGTTIGPRQPRCCSFRRSSTA